MTSKLIFALIAKFIAAIPMKSTIFRFNSIHKLLISFIFFSGAVSADDNANLFLPHLTDCAAFFGLLSQSTTEQSNQYKSMASAFSFYAAEIIPDEKITKETDNSMKKIAAFISNAKKDNDSQPLVTKLSMCMSVLQNAEKILRPKMPEFQQLLIPKIFE